MKRLSLMIEEGCKLNYKGPLLERGKGKLDTQKRRKACEDGDRNSSDLTTSKGMWQPQETGKGRGGYCPRASEERLI